MLVFQQPEITKSIITKRFIHASGFLFLLFILFLILQNHKVTSDSIKRFLNLLHLAVNYSLSLAIVGNLALIGTETQVGTQVSESVHLASRSASTSAVQCCR